MTIETIISSAVVSAVVAAVASIITAKISQRTAEKTAKETTDREIEMLRQTWAHDDNTAFEHAFKEMVDSVTRYLQDSSITKQEEARSKTAYVRSLVCGELADAVDDLFDSLKCRPARNGEEKLKAVIICKQHEAVSQP